MDECFLLGILSANTLVYVSYASKCLRSMGGWKDIDEKEIVDCIRILHNLLRKFVLPIIKLLGKLLTLLSLNIVVFKCIRYKT